MAKCKLENMAKSVHQRLVNLARREGLEPNVVLTRYLLERFLYRLSVHEAGERFVLKGAMLFVVWQGGFTRPTRDLDLLGYGDMSDASLRFLLEDICLADVPIDGVVFDATNAVIDDIRDANEYHGKRIHLPTRLGNGKYRLCIDVGIGDAVLDLPTVEFPTLLDLPAPELKAYTREAAVAEKCQAMVELGIRNSRMKDFYDIWVLSREFEFEENRLAKAIAATFDRRETPLPSSPPLAFTAEFADVPGKQVQWRAFLRRTRLKAPGELTEVIEDISSFLWPVVERLRNKSVISGELIWRTGGPWRGKRS